MASKYSAARPKRAGEAFARVHHGEKKAKFDVRNPSALAPDAREDDDVLDADVIGVGSGAATKRGAVNIDGYDSDSDNDTFNTRADKRGEGGEDDVDLADQLDNYDARLKGKAAKNGAEDDDEDDIFALPDDDAKQRTAGRAKKDKNVRFLDSSKIEGQEEKSRSGGHVRLDEESSSDEENVELEIQEEGLDDEVGAGGLKKHAPKIDAFNMRREQEEGAFDDAGNFIRKALDPDAMHDRWLEGFSKKDLKVAAKAHEQRAADLREQRKEEDSLITSNLIAALITRLERGETALEALARLGQNQAKHKAKRIPKWKQKKQKAAAGDMDVDATGEKEEPEHVKVREQIEAITEAADRLLKRDYADIYDTERELLVREYRSETGDAWVDTEPSTEKEQDGPRTQMWEYRWIDGRNDGATEGPFDGPTMKAWQDAGYFDNCEFRSTGDGDSWTRITDFV